MSYEVGRLRHMQGTVRNRSKSRAEPCIKAVDPPLAAFSYTKETKRRLGLVEVRTSVETGYLTNIRWLHHVLSVAFCFI